MRCTYTCKYATGAGSVWVDEWMQLLEKDGNSRAVRAAAAAAAAAREGEAWSRLCAAAGLG